MNRLIVFVVVGKDGINHSQIIKAIFEDEEKAYDYVRDEESYEFDENMEYHVEEWEVK